ncbi:MAG: hypothetical protein R2939_02680 [Kofleriaceae bacterium]
MRNYLPLASLLTLPMLMAAKGDGCAAGSRSPAPDVAGAWDITYDDVISVEVTLGGATYTAELGAQGGAFTVEHEGEPLTFDLDCDRPEVLCPSESWPDQVLIEQRNTAREHQMIVNLPRQGCAGTLSQPDPATCGAGTGNPDCELVCDGDVTVASTEAFGVIGEAGESFRLYLGGGLATNGLNCALLGWSVADAALTTTGTADDGDWYATSMDAGLVTVGYAGGCLWAGDPDLDGELEALLVGAQLRFTTGFTGARR